MPGAADQKSSNRSLLSLAKEPEKEQPGKTEKFYSITTLLPQTPHKKSVAASPSMPAKLSEEPRFPFWWGHDEAP